MIKLLGIRVASFVVLTLLVLSWAWVDKVSLIHVMLVLLYLSALPLIWWGCDYVFGVNDGRKDADFGKASGGYLWCDFPYSSRPVEFICWCDCPCEGEEREL